ncbi:MAG: sulfatase-like hydrolase/transferase [Betaproteobacteria bacterium]|nr:sulfatase-like hydrolase/transferase [Betaproteobacteria bacterium]
MHRRRFLQYACAPAIAAAAREPSAARCADGRPDIVLIVADDLAFGDLSCFGRTDFRTPNIDRLAEEGVRFTSAYAASPWCTPTRCALLTGCYPQRFPVGADGPLPSRSEYTLRTGLDPAVPTLASSLRDVGYDTALIGKWHLGYPPRFGPLRSGFDRFFGTHSGVVDPLSHLDQADNPDLFLDADPVTRHGYLTRLFTDTAVEYVLSHTDRPFFLNLSYTAPHWPWIVAGVDPRDTERSYAATLRELDAGVGAVLDALSRRRHPRDTLVAFTSDNGGDGPARQTPLSGGKGSLREGGIRVPTILRWPAHASLQGTRDEVICSMDLTETLLTAAGAAGTPHANRDGCDVVRLLEVPAPPTRTLFWSDRDRHAVRHGPWKYLFESGDEHLYDLDRDIAEQRNLSAALPDLCRELAKRHARWLAAVTADRAGA